MPFRGSPGRGRKEFLASPHTAALMPPRAADVALWAAEGAGAMPVLQMFARRSEILALPGWTGQLEDASKERGPRLQTLGITGRYARRWGGGGGVPE